MSNAFRSIGAIAAISVTLAASPARAQDINTIVGPHCCGILFGGNSWVGQTFTVPVAATFLNSISFHLGLYAGGGPGNFVIKAWDGSNPTGAAVFASALPTITTTWTDTASLATFSIGQSLTGGAVYVAYVNATVPSGYASLAWNFTYSGGNTVVNNNFGVDDSWSAIPNFDQGFRADFSDNVVPEPATVVLLATGLLGIGGVGLVRLRKDSAA